MGEWDSTARVVACIPPGKMIFITGTPYTTAKRFTINIQDGNTGGRDYGLHFDVRFNHLCEVNTIVCNHKSNGGFGHEERGVPYFPFVPNCSFEMIIMCENTGYKILVNNQYFVEFKYRVMPFSRYDLLKIVGDINVSQIRFL